MGAKKNDILQGTLALLILKTLASHRRLHGYAITSHIQRVSDQLLRVEEGSLYPALHRMEQDGWVRAEWGKTEKNREARFYSLTPLGRKQLAQEEENWARLTAGVARVIEYAWEAACPGMGESATR
jgi:PadR family transcriptional regulator, regulatory protein PadR